MKKIGILALQGDFDAHRLATIRAGACPVLVRDTRGLASVDALIIPGGESTTMLKLLAYDGMMDALRLFTRNKPVFGTCAGAILLAKDVVNPRQESLAAIDMRIERNAYGRQKDSRIVLLVPEAGSSFSIAHKSIEAVFIRAPIIRSVGPEVQVLARYDDTPVLVRQGMHMAATFHPELSETSEVHVYFIESIGSGHDPAITFPV